MSFAVIQTGGKQYKVSASEILKVERLESSEGKTVEFKNKTFLNSIVFPSESSSLSTLRISLAETLYCLPPVCITAKDIVLISYLETWAI